MSKPLLLNKDSTISFYKESHIFWLSNVKLYKVSDSVYSIKELKAFLKTDKRAYRYYRVYKTNVFASGIFSGMFLAGIFALADGLTHRQNVFPAIVAIPIACWLSDFYQKRGNQSLKKAISVYNARL